MWRLSCWTKRASIINVCLTQRLFSAIIKNLMEKSHWTREMMPSGSNTEIGHHCTTLLFTIHVSQCVLHSFEVGHTYALRTANLITEVRDLRHSSCLVSLYWWVRIKRGEWKVKWGRGKEASFLQTSGGGWCRGAAEVNSYYGWSLVAETSQAITHLRRVTHTPRKKDPQRGRDNKATFATYCKILISHSHYTVQNV